jgi:hypothetical protein
MIIGDAMSYFTKGRIAAALVLGASLALAASQQAEACACGCGVFGVGTSSLFPSGSGGQLFAEYDFMDQNQNHSGLSTAPAANNDDKEIRTNFVTLGGEYMVNRDWGVMVELPYWQRTFKTDLGPPDGVTKFDHSAFGDVRLIGVYTGLSPDMSTGLTLGVKVPTGDWKYANFDRDTEIGTGSTDVLFGGYHLGPITKDNSFSYFVQGLFDIPVASQGGYKPGNEVDAAAGGYYKGWMVGGGKLRISPVLQFLVSARAKDSGVNADPQDSGYLRGIVSPGIEVGAAGWKLYGDVEIPVYQNFVGNQLAAHEAFKLILSRDF